MTRSAWAGAAALILSALAGCGQQPSSEANDSAGLMPLPEKVCNDARQGLEKIGKSGGLEYSDKGEATIGEDAWLRLPENAREQIAQLLAFHAACAAEQPPREQSVVIRSEFGRVLTQRVVETGADLSGLLEEE
jgi:hypothetical protein